MPEQKEQAWATERWGPQMAEFPRMQETEWKMEQGTERR